MDKLIEYVYAYVKKSIVSPDGNNYKIKYLHTK